MPKSADAVPSFVEAIVVPVAPLRPKDIRAIFTNLGLECRIARDGNVFFRRPGASAWAPVGAAEWYTPENAEQVRRKLEMALGILG